MIAVTNHM